MKRNKKRYAIPHKFSVEVNGVKQISNTEYVIVEQDEDSSIVDTSITQQKPTAKKSDPP